MAARKPAKVAAPVKQKLRKNHGPKRKLFHDWDSTTRLALAKAGLLSKYSNYQSFALSLNARGIKKDVEKYWKDFCLLPNLEARKAFFKNLKA